ncbi:MAG: DNA topoisomerase 4 subunit A [Firmicutes bacterium]|nr:DNA topoisomerase 4 subunit A [Bacillota bacterium]
MEAENKQAERVIDKALEEVMHDSMMPYSEHVILDRALPRVEDGLKPVQRRILYSMYELGVTADKPYRKSARIVGDCLGKYHPHGDKSVYDAMVRMAQNFNMRCILVDGHGNFGSVDGDTAAAMRYTEARLAPLAGELLRDLEKDTVRWACNFDDTTKEPEMLPGRFPNLLVNGSSGIAVGLATNIPPHNISEVIDGVVAFIDNPKIDLLSMMKFIKGPDFPTGGYIINQDLEKAYETGKGKIVIRAKCHIENGDNEKKLIVIDELPYQVNKASLLESILDLREEKKGVLMGISEISDESDRNGMRAVIKVKKDCDPKEILQVLFKSTSLSNNFSINMVAIANGKPQQLGLLDIIRYYVAYQREVVLRRTRFELAEAKEKEHILEGLVIAVKNIDEVIKIIKQSASTPLAKEALRKRFDLSERQAQAILDLRLARLTHLEVYKLEQDLKNIKELIARLTAIVASKARQMDLVKEELLAIKKLYKENRKSVVLASLDEYVVPSEDDAKPLEEYIVAITGDGNIKRMLKRNFSMATKDFTANSVKHEFCKSIIRSDSRSQVLIFTNMGNVYRVDSDSLPEGKWRERGGKLKDFVKDCLPKEIPIKLYPAFEEPPKGEVIFFTKDGMLKRSKWNEYGVAKASFQAAKVKDGDEVIGIETVKKGMTVLFVTSQGMCLNADLFDVPVQGRVSGGVKGINLTPGDKCIMASLVNGEGEVVLISDKAFAKRVIIGQIDTMARYRKGIKIFDFSTKKGNGEKLVFAKTVTDPYKIVLDVEGVLEAYSTEDIAIQNRTSSGKGLVKKIGESGVSKVYKYLDKEDDIK